MTDDPELARILEEAPTRPLSASLQDLIKPFAVRLVAHALHHEAEEYRLQECSGRRTEDGKLESSDVVDRTEGSTNELTIGVPRVRLGRLQSH